MSYQHKVSFPNVGKIQSVRNQILNALPEEQYARLLPFLEPVALDHGTILYNSGDLIQHIYFPISGMVSVNTLMDDGKTIEIGVIGREGMVGLDVVLGAERSSHESMVRIPGAAYRIKTSLICDEFQRRGGLQNILLRYTHTLLLHSSQTGACNQLHTLEQKMATWMMIWRDRTDSDCLPLTQECIADMLGVNRPTVSFAAGKFQREGVIEYSRGRINITNPAALENLACQCYQAIKTEYPGLLH